MYGIHTYIYHKHQPNVGKYTIHGSYGLYNSSKKMVQFPMLQAIPNPLVGGPQVEINFCGEIPMSELVGTNTQVGFFWEDLFFSGWRGVFFGVFLGGFLVERRRTFFGGKKSHNDSGEGEQYLVPGFNGHRRGVVWAVVCFFCWNS